MPAVPMIPESVDFDRIINAVRLELQQAGNPAFIVAIVDASGAAHVAPMVFSAVGPSSDHARRVLAALAPGEHVLIVSRHASRSRQKFNVLDPGTLRKLHVADEVIEAALVETDGPV